jgi:hypothetical protein
MATDCAAEWEYCHLGPADSFLGLLGDLKAKTSQGWELAGVRNDSAKVYATVKRPVREMALAEQKVA